MMESLATDVVDGMKPPGVEPSPMYLLYMIYIGISRSTTSAARRSVKTTRTTSRSSRFD
jgi:hypothetical protein